MKYKEAYSFTSLDWITESLNTWELDYKSLNTWEWDEKSLNTWGLDNKMSEHFRMRWQKV